MSATQTHPFPLPEPRSYPREIEPPLRMSYEEFLEWLDEDTHADWVDGVVEMHSPVAAPHVRVSRYLQAIMIAYLEENPIGEFFHDPFQIKIGADFPGRAPDIVFVKTEQSHLLQNSVLRGAPDLIVEIGIPGSRNCRNDREIKFAEYERGGVPEYWLIEPEAQTVDVFQRNSDGNYAMCLPDSIGRLHSRSLPGFFIFPEWLWNPPKVAEVVQSWKSAGQNTD